LGAADAPAALLAADGLAAAPSGEAAAADGVNTNNTHRESGRLPALFFSVLSKIRPVSKKISAAFEKL